MNSMNKFLSFQMRLQDFVTPAAPKIVSWLRRIDQNVKGLGSSFDKQGRKVRLFFNEAHKGAKSLRDGLASIPSRLFNLPNLLAASVVGLTLGVAVEASSFKATNLKAFEIMAGSQAAGGALFEQGRQFANLTPFSTKDVLGTTRGLAQTFAPTDVPNVLAAVGDIAAMNNFDPQVLDRVTLALNQINRAGRLMGEEFNQLSDVGAPTQEMYRLLAQLHGTNIPGVMKLQEQGAISSEQAIWAFLEATRTHVSGGVLGQFMKTMSGEIPGLLSTLRSKPFDIFMDLDTTPLKRFLTNLVNLTDTTTSLGSRFKNAINASFGSVLAAIFNPLANAAEPDRIIAWLESLEGRFDQFSLWWSSNMPGIMEWLRGFGEGFLSSFSTAWNWLEKLIPSLSNLNVHTGDTTAQSGKLWGRLAAVAAMLGAVNFATGGLAGSLVGGLLPALATVLTRMGVWGVVLTGVIAGFTFLYNKVAWFREQVDLSLANVSIMFETMAYNFNLAKEAIGSGLEWLKEKFDWFMNKADEFHNSGVGAQRGAAFMNWLGLGNNVTGGLQQGINQGQPGVKSATDTLLENTAGRFANQMEIHSPSRLGVWQGRMWPLGLASGILAGLPTLAQASNQAVQVLASPPALEQSYTPQLLATSGRVSSKPSRSLTIPQVVVNVNGAQQPQAIMEEFEGKVAAILFKLMNEAADETDGGEFFEDRYA
jgi:tape measure domain-containing protein